MILSAQLSANCFLKQKLRVNVDVTDVNMLAQQFTIYTQMANSMLLPLKT